MTARPESLAPLLARAQLWRGNQQASVRTQSTGHPGLDALLPGGGWPVGALSEVLTPRLGCGELQLLMPWLIRLTQAGGRVALLRPPLLPYAPAFAQSGVVLSRLLVVNPENEEAAQWACEQSLRSGGFSAVLAWPGRIANQALRKLQLAAEAGDACGILYRNRSSLSEASPAALRLELKDGPERLSVMVHKCRGGMPGRRWQQAA
ncbi:translesion DNA synthesis-associated protein ImuA [Algiphilus sp. NNCM1]|uniref:translesion DNA synthesis-associated protein ImuA n=1 Tax=Algiphilus sp. TaxID=1872431 RepID=UPI001CA73480|nr:translesion DNA synthesis-associated protein ImuA [Algiphilus sp.]MBY8964306.1 translesion DNA synthesis-associated protein ImuA [Algiphilus acroporae]MCI5104349.1 translesion DNA synthesis-associated protein ImuA [Algiphilus sp.]